MKSLLSLLIIIGLVSISFAGKESLQVITNFDCYDFQENNGIVQLGVGYKDKKGIMHYSFDFEEITDCISLIEEHDGNVEFDEFYEDYSISLINLTQIEEGKFQITDLSKKARITFYSKNNDELSAYLMFDINDLSGSFFPSWSKDYFSYRKRWESSTSSKETLVAGSRDDSNLSSSRAFHNGERDTQSSNSNATSQKTKTTSVEGISVASIEGKELIDIELEFYYGKDYIGYLDKDFVYFNVIATLEDGSKVKTSEEKFLDDYVFQIEGGEFTYGNQMDLYDYGLYEAGKGKLISKNRFRSYQYFTSELYNDQVKITVRSKYQDFSKEVFYTMPYDLNLTLDMRGQDGIEGATYPKNCGSASGEYRLKVGMTQHKITGESLVCYTILRQFADRDKEEIYAIVKAKPGVQIFFNGQGGKGYIGPNNGSSSYPGDGGDGAEVSILVDPNAISHYNLSFNVSAGNPAYGGNDGKKGKYEIIEGTVTIPSNY